MVLRKECLLCLCCLLVQASAVASSAQLAPAAFQVAGAPRAGRARLQPACARLQQRQGFVVGTAGSVLQRHPSILIPASRCAPLKAAGLYQQDRLPVGTRLLGGLLAFFRWLLRGGRSTRFQPLQAPVNRYLDTRSMVSSAASSRVSYAAAAVAARRGPSRPVEQPSPAAVAAVAAASLFDVVEEAAPTLDERPMPDTPVPLTGKLFSWALQQLIYRAALRVEGLDMLVEASSNRDALSGNLKNVWINFKTLALPQMQITGGASMVVTGVDLKMLYLMHRRLGAFKKPFQVRGEWSFTNNDFIASPAIRNMVQNILAASFARLNLGPVRVSRVSISGDRILFEGHSDILQRFSCSANLATSQDGHVISLRSLKYGNQAGEYLFQTPWQVAATLPKDLVSCDMGDNTRIEALSIRNGRLTVRGMFVVTPTPPLIVADVGKRGMVRYDVGERLSALVSEVLDRALTPRAPRLW